MKLYHRTFHILGKLRFFLVRGLSVRAVKDCKGIGLLTLILPKFKQLLY